MKSYLASIILHDIGGSTVKEQYREGPKIATNLLRQLCYTDDFIENVCEMVRTHHERPENPSETFQILYDADQLAKFSPEEFHYYKSN